MTNADNLLSEPFNPGSVVLGSNQLFRRDSTFDTLPHQNPFITSGLRYASPPVEFDLEQYGGINIFSPTNPFTFSVGTNGTLVATAFPQAARIASQTFVNPSALLSLSLSYAITQGSNTGPIALFVLIDSKPIVGVGGNADVLLGTIVPTGTAATDWSDTRSNSFSIDVAPILKAGESISLYCSCANNAVDLVWGIVSLKYVTL